MDEKTKTSKRPLGFGMTTDRFDAFYSKNENGKLIYQLFEADLADALTLEYCIPDLIEAKKNKTKLDVLNIKKNAKKQNSERTSKHRKEISNKEDKYIDEIEKLMASISDISRSLSKEIEKNNGIQTDGVLKISNLLSEEEKKLNLTKERHAREITRLESVFESDIEIIQDIERDDIRNCIRLQSKYTEKLTDSLKSAINDINEKYPTKVLKMEPIIDVEVLKGEPVVTLPLNIIEFIKNKIITIKLKPNVNSKFNVTEDEADDNEKKELIRMENAAIIKEAKKEKEKEKNNK